MSFSDVLNIQTHNMVKQLIPENLQNVSEQLADIVNYNLSDFCNGIDRTQDFVTFLDGLDSAIEKTLFIPKNKILLLSRYIAIPSNTTLTGGGKIIFDSESELPATLFNPALVNNRGAFDFTEDKNIVLENVTLEFDCSISVCSLVRLRGVDGITIKNCAIKITSLVDGKRHNALIDLFKGCKNAYIYLNKMYINTKNSTSGGCIWIRNIISDISPTDTEALDCNNINIYDNYLESNGGDEMVATFSSGNSISNIHVYHNHFRRLPSLKNVCLTALALTSNNVDISNIKYEDNTFIIDQESANSKEVIRIGSNGETIAIKDFLIANNTVRGMLDTSIAINTVGGTHSGIIERNTVINDGLKATSTGIQSNSAKIKILNNTLKNINAPIVKVSGTLVSNNVADDVNLDGLTIYDQNIVANGYLRLGNGMVMQWVECYVDVNNGSEKSFTCPYSWSGGIVMHYSCSVKSITGTPFDNKAISLRPSGVNQIILTNPNSQFVTVEVFMITKR